MQPDNTQQIDWKQHATDFAKGILAAVAVAAGQAILSYLAHIDWNHALSIVLGALGATAGVKAGR